jgi:hypothetical protein
MARRILGYHRLGYRGLCVGCKAPFVGKGDRCQPCADKLRLRHKRKRR